MAQLLDLRRSRLASIEPGLRAAELSCELATPRAQRPTAEGAGGGFSADSAHLRSHRSGDAGRAQRPGS